MNNQSLTSRRTHGLLQGGVVFRLLCWTALLGILIAPPFALGHKPKNVGPSLGVFNLTYYYAAQSRGDGTWPLYGPACREVLAYVSKSFHDDLSLEGSGHLSDGRVINFEERCDCAQPGFRGSRICYSILDRRQYPWGRGALINGQYPALRPFRSVAVDPGLIPLGSLIYVPLFRGKRTPDGKLLSGCFQAVDTGAMIRGKKIDLFSGTHSWSEWFRKTYQISRIKVYQGGDRCRQ